MLPLGLNAVGEAEKGLVMKSDKTLSTIKANLFV